MKEIEYFYSAHSLYAYLGSRKLMQIAATAGRRIVHRPMDLRAVVAQSGAVPFGRRSQAHKDYFFGREMERWAEQRDVKMMKSFPRHHAHDIALPNCLLIAAIAAQLDVDALAHRLLEAHWLEDGDLADATTLESLAVGLGLDGVALLVAARSEPILAQYRANTEEALARSVFGSPTYFVDGDMFYGQDRLEMVERALQQAYAHTGAGGAPK
ncbi:MAG: 2-hydroxychromene-2-carboxylate isomerase [Rhodospirillales bacterium]